MGRAARSVALMIGAATVVVTTPAAAHPAIDEARERYGWADFGGALAALARAEHADNLSEEELREILALRATIHFAMRSDDAFRRALRTLASIAPDYRFDDDLPPPFVEAWERARDEAEPLSVRVEVRETPRGPRIQAYVEGSAHALVSAPPKLRARVEGEAWRRGSDGIVRLDAPPGSVVEYFAEAHGPGGVVVARSGSARGPRVVRLLGVDHPTGKGEPRDADSTDHLPWFLAGGAGLVALATSVALVVVVSRDDSPSTVIRPPSLATP